MFLRLCVAAFYIEPVRMSTSTSEVDTSAVYRYHNKLVEKVDDRTHQVYSSTGACIKPAYYEEDPTALYQRLPYSMSKPVLQ